MNTIKVKTLTHKALQSYVGGTLDFVNPSVPVPYDILWIRGEIVCARMASSWSELWVDITLEEQAAWMGRGQWGLPSVMAIADEDVIRSMGLTGRYCYSAPVANMTTTIDEHGRLHLQQGPLLFVLTRQGEEPIAGLEYTHDGETRRFYADAPSPPPS